jgi:hypothetical protein
VIDEGDEKIIKELHALKTQRSWVSRLFWNTS